MIPKIERFGEKACRVTAGDTILFFSYETCVAISNVGGMWGETEAVRIAAPSATSARHMEMMGCSRFREVSLGEFKKIASYI